jgi:carbamoyl-phosphate synthase large subunit
LYQKDLFDNSYVIPRCSEENYWDEITKIIKKHNIELAIVQPELEVLEWSKRSKTHELPCKVLLPDHDLVKALVDKATMTEHLEPFGVVPSSVRIDPMNIDFSSIEKKLKYPFWIRSTSGSSGLGSLKVMNELSLKNWMLINPDVKEFLASEFLPGRNLACKLLYFKGNLVRAAIGERVNYIMSKVAPSGITGNTSFGRLLNDQSVFEVSRKALEEVMDKTKVEKHGFFTVDLKEDLNGKPKVTEVNVRMVAFNGCFAQGGANFAEDIIRLLNEDLNFDLSFKLHKFDEDLIFLRDVDALPIVMHEKDLLK